MEYLRLPRWDKEKLVVPIRIIITGKTNTGKTHYAKSLISFLRDKIDKLYVMCPTMKEGSWESITSKSHIFDEYDPEVILDVIEKQKRHMKEDKKMDQVMFILDDCIHDITKKDKTVNKLYTQGRHWNISIIIISQKFVLINNTIRANPDFCICTRIVNAKELDAIWKEYNNGISRSDFGRMCNLATEGFGVLVIDNVSRGFQMYLRDRALPELKDFYVEVEAKKQVDRKRMKKVDESEGEE